MGLKSLKHLEIQFLYCHGLVSPNGILLPTVEFLHVEITPESHPAHVNNFLGNIQATALVALSLNRCCWHQQTPPEPNKFPSLRHLIIYDCLIEIDRVNFENIANLSQQFPNITRFTHHTRLEECCDLEVVLQTMLGDSIDDVNEDDESGDDEDRESGDDDGESDDDDGEDSESDDDVFFVY